MKKIMLSALFFIAMLSVRAQSTAPDTVSKKSAINGNNELKLNMLMTILGAPEVSYERIIGDDMGLGISVLVGADKYELDYNFAFTPYYRLYFGKQKAKGFFIEANSTVASLDGEYYYYDGNGYYTSDSRRSKNEVSFGFGVAAGAKFLTKKGFIGEIYSGVGRYFGDNYHEAYPRVGITIGKRF